METKKDQVSKRTKLFKDLLELQKKIDKCKSLFDQRDNLYLEISKLGLGQFFYGDFQFLVKDNFESKNKAFKVAGVNRFEVSYKEIKNNK